MSRKHLPALLALLWAPTSGCSVDEPVLPLAGVDPPDAGIHVDDAGTAGSGAGGEGGMGGADAGPDGPDASIPGVLVEAKLKSRVAVLLDDLPPAMRDRVADAVLLEPPSFWEARARLQLKLTATYGYYYEKFVPLPPPETWNIALDAAGPQRTTEDGHDVVAVPYTFTGTILTDWASPLETSPALIDVDDQVKFAMGLPIDPELVYQRVAETCVDSDGVQQPFPSCSNAIASKIGRVETTMFFTKIAWDKKKADSVRIGAVTFADGADIAVRAEGLAHNRLIYRYIPDDDCSIVEKCVGGPGWRRLLQFDATVHNQGAKPIHIGAIRGGDWVSHNVFSYSPCHEHYHFLHYGDFSLGPNLGDKRAFCLISTSRYSNNESTSMVTPYEFCDYQGIAAGWGDDYGIGLDCQWIDVTDVDLSAGPVTLPLQFVSNPDKFLCEGKPVLDGNGKQVFEPTAFVTEDGDPIDRPKCDFFPGSSDNNTGVKDVTLPTEGGYVNEPCTGMPLGARRDCGFTKQDDALGCTPDAPVQLSCAVADPTQPQVVRICERSAVLGTGVACAYSGALSSTVVEGSTVVSFTCPGPRDATEPGGSYAIYTAPAYPGDPGQVVTCASM